MELDSSSSKEAMTLAAGAESITRSESAVAPLGILRDVLAERGGGAVQVARNPSSVWEGIVRGQLRFEDCFYAPQRAYAVLGPSAAGRPLAPRERILVEHVVAGASLKCIAHACRVSLPTVSASVHRIFRAMGLLCLPSKYPLIVALLARARTQSNFANLRVTDLTVDNRKNLLISAERPELKLARSLSRAEYEVVLRVIEGWSHADIAEERQTSLRTIANQLASAFRRLGVSGRAQLVAMLASGSRGADVESGYTNS